MMMVGVEVKALTSLVVWLTCILRGMSTLLTSSPFCKRFQAMFVSMSTLSVFPARCGKETTATTASKFYISTMRQRCDLQAVEYRSTGDVTVPEKDLKRLGPYVSASKPPRCSEIVHFRPFINSAGGIYWLQITPPFSLYLPLYPPSLLSHLLDESTSFHPHIFARLILALLPDEFLG
ncbi:hypothetical protein PROFUN_07485 [Planoprotostelium fungivorum]|uniref:Uncharacterized protein n=1 Tax=Planoprotostelium fungivorum TaxID=1890364 RepID=A0A2P6NLJ7_9EUKA|nr:hypothetical protein PROFUN_07485 [Planoprotostelium fungivorum]